MKIRFHHWVAIFIVTLFTDVEYDLSAVKIRPIDVFLLLVIIARAISGKTIFKPINNPTVAGIYVFLCYIFINSLTKVTLGESIKETVQLFEYVIIMFMIAESTSTRQKRLEFLNILLWGTGLVAFYAAYYAISSGHYSGFKELDAPKHSFAFFALLATTRYFTKPKKNAFDILLILISYVVVLLGGERKGWAGLFVGLCFFLWFQVRYHLTKGKLNALLTFGFAFSILVVIGITVLSDPEFGYFNRQVSSLSDVQDYFGGSASGGSSFQSSSDQERIFMFNYGLVLFYQNPFFGIGIDQFIVRVTNYSNGLITHDAHNFYLKILDEEGLVGIFLYLTVLTLLFIGLFRLSKNKSKSLAQDAQIALTIFLLGSVVNFFLAGKALSWLYLVQPCGMMLAIQEELKIENVKKSVTDKVIQTKSLVTGSITKIKRSFS